MKAKVQLTVCLILTTLGSLLSQIPEQDSILVDSTSLLLDSIISGFNAAPDTTGLSQITISPDAPPEGIDYVSRDSMIYDIENQKIYLYGEAKINYTSIQLEADYIEFDWSTNIVYAKGLPDSTGRISGQPAFQDGEQRFNASEMRYNFKSGKGIVYDAATTQDELYVLGEKAKYITSQDTNHTDVIYSKRAIFTTCNHPEPHFGIRSTKQKVVPNQVAIVGPSNLEIMGVPTPVWLPFGFFPLSKTKSTGLIFPRGYQYNPSGGFGLRNVGWYFPINDYMDLQLTGDVFIKGSFRLRSTVNYAKRYKYRGGFTFEYGNNRVENESNGAFERTQNFLLTLRHNQDAKAHPSRSIGGNITIQTNDAIRSNYNDANSQQNTNLSSSFNYSESFPGRPYTLSAGLTHSQNTKTRKVTINFPDFRFNLNSVYPFQNKKGSSGGNPTWYEKIALTYRGEAKATLNATDTTLFDPSTLQNIRYGARNNIDLNTNLKLFKYFNITPSADYTEIWYFQKQQKFFDPTIMETIEFDTLENGEIEQIITDVQYGEVIDSTLTEFTPLRQYRLGANMDTKLFGTVLFKKGLIRGFRHQMTPSVGVSFVPDYTNPNLGYFQEVQVDTRFPDSTQTYSIFENGIYNKPNQNGQQFLINYGLRNIVETKLYSKQDSSTRNVRLLQSFDFRGSYNMAAEEFNWSTISLNGSTRIFNGVTNLQFRATFDPYMEDSEGERIEEFVWNDRRLPARLTNANLRVTSTLRVSDIRNMFKANNPGEEQLAPGANTKKGDLLSLFENFSINHTLVIDRTKMGGVDTLAITSNTIYFRGNIDLTEKWRVTVGSFGYDFVNKGITFPSLAVTRDLHCWEMGISWQPTLNTYAFYLRVDQGSFLDFLNIPYRKGSQDPFFNTAGGGYGGFGGF
ncbi:MAG: LPS-assembly protein LptD [Bacteroidetes bacterium]|nr:LPS-assembly protein LptD [Bacteroidota bacterium]